MKYSLCNIFSAAVALMALNAASATDLVCSPGELSSLVENPESVTVLRLSGTANAADLFFIDSDMKNLTTLDLSDLTIDAYNGEALRQKMNYAAATIPTGTFSGSNISTLILPETPVTLGDMCFSGTKIKNLTLGSYVTLGTGVFAACPELESVTLHTSSTGNYTFRDCPALKSVTLTAATQTGDYAFAGCSALEEVVAPVMHTVGEASFNGCSALKSFDFDTALRSIGNSAFTYSGLENIMLEDCESLTSIGEWAFAHCTALKVVELPESLTSMGEGAFFECTALATISAPGGINALPAYAFKGAFLNESPALLQEGISSIGNHALSGAGAQNVNFPSTLSYLGDNAMENMSNLQTLNAQALQSVPEVGQNVWQGVMQQDVALSVAPELYEDFKVADQWKEFNIKNMSTLITPEEVMDVNIRARFSGSLLELSVSGTTFAQVQIYSPAGMLLGSYDLDSDAASIDTASFSSNLMLVRCFLADGQVTILKLAR